MKRLSNKTFPPYRFLPGQGPHPEKKGGYLYGKEKSFEPLSEENYISNETYLYSIDLFNNSYFWESHVYWELFWNDFKRKGDNADFFKGLIKFAAAGVKFQLNQSELSLEHLHRSKELLINKNIKFGIDSSLILKEIDKYLNEKIEMNFKIELN